MKLMTHIVAGYPTMAECEKIALEMADAGVAYIEIQIPFSDPIADGKTIMEANMQALRNGVTPDDCFRLIERLQAQIDVPILIMTYFNIAFRYGGGPGSAGGGLAAFCEKARDVGCYGLIIPDIPVDEEKYDGFLKACKKSGLHAIQIVSPITPVRRLEKIARVASGFVYCVSGFGTTGVRKKLGSSAGADSGSGSGLRSYLEQVRRTVKLPLAVGFGISSKEQVSAVSKHADIVVIGSKMINLYNEKGLKEVGKFLRGVSD